MVRVYISTALMMLLLMANAAQAAEISIRTGSHADYSRLVFDWPEKVKYTAVKQGENKLKIEFEKAATLNTAQAASNPVDNISGIEVLSEAPLSVLVSVPPTSRVRDFTAANKVIIDVYNPTTKTAAAQTFTVKSEAPPKDSPKAEEPAVPKAAANEKPDEKPDEKAPEIPSETAASEPPPEEELIELKGKEPATMITVSSTKAFGLAVFENAGKLWLVNDQNDILLTPQISGPEAKKLGKLESSEIGNAKIYNLSVPDGLKVKGAGGGVLWRLLFSPDLTAALPIDPVRTDVNEDEVRSGKLMWPLEGARSVLETIDPITGEKILIVTVEDAKQLAGPPRQFIDFDVLNSFVGLAIVPKIDDLQVKVVRGGVEISSPKGLAIASQNQVKAAIRDIESRAETPEGAKESTDARIYDFDTWQLGGIDVVQENRNVILADLNDMSEGTKVENILTLAKMYLSNGMGHEAIGMLRFAENELPDLVNTPEFLSLRGAASALAGHNEDAFKDLSAAKLKEIPEVQMWRSYVLANLGDWQQAVKVKPDNLNALYDYPPKIRNDLTLGLAEIVLRNGEVDKGKTLLDLVEKDMKNLAPELQASLQYLKGEAARQENETKETRKFWEPLTTGKDDRFRVKAGLALTRLQMDEGEITRGNAIDNLERLRYAWRGDELEAQVNFWLGKTYFDSGQFIKGLKIMREASSFVPNTNLSQRIAENMGAEFTNLYLNKEKLSKTLPTDAVALYDQFTELVPLGEEGTRVIKALAEHLVNANMFGRAGDLLAGQLARLDGEEAVSIAARLAAIRLLDKKPDQAAEALNVAQSKLQALPAEKQNASKYLDLSLMRARSLSLQGRPDQALVLLEDLDKTRAANRLRADIAWQASYWDDAAEALGDVILDQEISLTRPLDAENTALLLQRAVALNLASDRVALANMREKYSDAMAQTQKAKIFEVITRPRQNAALADRETLLSVAQEVDLFSEFLNTYKDEIN